MNTSNTKTQAHHKLYVESGGNLSVGVHLIEFDAADSPLVLAHKWDVVKKKHNFYARTSIGGKKIKMHQLLSPGPMVDHKDGDGLNNRRENLRPCSRAQNTWNRRKIAKATSRFKGVWKVNNRRNSFDVSVTCNGKRHKLGRFFDEIAAALAYDITAVKLHGEFARPNFSIVEAALVHPASLELAIRRCQQKGVLTP